MSKIAEGALRRESRIDELVELIPHHDVMRQSLRGSIRVLLVAAVTKAAEFNPKLKIHWGLGHN